MVDRYEIGLSFNLIDYSNKLVEFIDFKKSYTAREYNFGFFISKLMVSNSYHQCVIEIKRGTKYITINIYEKLGSYLLNMGAVIGETIIGFVVGKDKGVGKSLFGAAGYKAWENLFYKKKIKKLINEFTINYLKQ